MNQDSTKGLPHSPLAEKSLLSVAMQRHDLLSRAVAEGIGEDSFYIVAHKTIWNALRKADGKYHNHDAEIKDPNLFDLAGFAQQLHLEGQLDLAGGHSMVVEIFTYAANSAGFGTWIRQLRQTQAHRRALSLAHAIGEAGTAQDAREAIETAADEIKRTLAGMRRAIPAKEIVAAFSDSLKADYETGDIPGAPTGIECIDAHSGGMRPGELWVIGGKPSAGKSVLMLQVASHAVSCGKTVFVSTLEMMAREIVGRLISCIGHIDMGSITQPRTASAHDLKRVLAIAADIATKHLFVDDGPGQNADTIAAEAERIRDATGALDLVVVDYLQLIRAGRQRNESREEEVARASGKLKDLAKRLKCPVLTASQLNEDGKTRESRAIEQDADALLLIGQDGVLVQKLRNGRRDHVFPLILNGSRQRFYYDQTKERQQ